ncbi:pyridoxal-phosphate dependent enzyme [Sorangium cellulosum]|uniref:pyridoxal-phosphate dependent enzyme n=1 Tax=Sorangium cellulosum TaxID=56 RepID=UPI000CF4A87E
MLGASVIRSGDSYEDALEHARSLVARHDWRFLPAFDDPDVIAGQGTFAGCAAMAPIDDLAWKVGRRVDLSGDSPGMGVACRPIGCRATHRRSAGQLWAVMPRGLWRESATAAGCFTCGVRPKAGSRRHEGEQSHVQSRYHPRLERRVLPPEPQRRPTCAPPGEPGGACGAQ